MARTKNADAPWIALAGNASLSRMAAEWIRDWRRRRRARARESKGRWVRK